VHGHECRTGLSSSQSLRGVDARAGGHQGRPPRRFDRAGVAVDLSSAGGAELFDGIEIRSVVDALQLGSGGGAGDDGNGGLGDAGGVQALSHRAQPSRSLGVSAPGVVLQAGRVRDEEDRTTLHHRNATPGRRLPPSSLVSMSRDGSFA
jgi:hypothetical protein